MHSRSRYGSHYIEYPFPVIKCIENRRHLAHVLGKCPKPYQMAGYPEQFAHHYTYDLSPVGRYNTCQFFDRKKICQVIHNTPEVIDTVGIWDKGMPRLSLSHFLSSTMMESYIGYNIYNIFSVQLNY